MLFSLFCFALFFILDHPRPLESTEVPNSTMPPSANANPLTSHVLDTAAGKPAAGVNITLFKMEGGNWRHITSQLTNSDGRVGNLIGGEDFTPAWYKLTFDTMAYYASQKQKTFYPYIDIVFEIEKPEEHYHVPVLLSAYGYTTYRGS